MKPLKIKAEIVQFLKKRGLIVFLLSILTILPAIAQTDTIEKADVVLDGRRLFEIHSAEQFSAQQRADWITFQLQEVVKSSEKPRIKIEERNQLPAIILNDRYLFTVTQRDINSGNTLTEQAEILAQQIRQEVTQAQRERSFQFLWQALLGVVGVLFIVVMIHWALGKLLKRLQIRLPQLLKLDDPSEKSSKKVLNFSLKIVFFQH